ncbi:MAG: cupin domain-containing protein [Flavobacterium sp.]|nr:cupin domain-containing protein [Flavobacterium sp.]
MNLTNLHSSDKPVQTQVLFEPTENKVIALQIAKNEQLKEHVTKVPALLICVTGEATFSNENGEKIHLKSGDFIKIPVDVKHWVDAHELSNFLLIK